MTDIDAVEFAAILALAAAVWAVWRAGAKAVVIAIETEREHAAESLKAERAEAARALAEATVKRDEMIGEVDRLGGENDDLRRENLALRAVPPPEPMSEADIEKARANVCVHCGGVHAIACPRVRSMRFRSDGSVIGVEFWADNEWPKNRVIFLEDHAPSTGVPEPTQGA